MAGIHRRRRRRPTSDEQYAKMLARMLAAWKPRAENDPLTGLTYLRQFQQLLDDAANSAIHHGINGNRQPQLSPTALADALGVSRQAIYKRATIGEQVAKRPSRPARPTITTARVAKPRELPPGA